uniref:Uncharacterized protein n=1 Tax=Globodera rostochiensis TaxID=31243 RepID=A0A914HBR4_GLORO
MAGRWNHQQQQAEVVDPLMASIRKHRSLEGVHQLLLDNPSCSSAPSMFPPPPPPFSEPPEPNHHQHHHFTDHPVKFVNTTSSLLQPMLFPSTLYHHHHNPSGYTHPTSTINDHPHQFPPAAPSQHQSRWMPPSIGSVPQGMHPRQKGMAPLLSKADGDNPTTAWPLRTEESLQASVLYQPVSAHTILQQVDLDPRALRREFAALCDRFNYLAATVRTFWAPELRRERHRWREQCRRFNELEQRLSLTTSEAQMLRTELQAIRRDEHRQLEDRHPTLPRDFTEIRYTMHEWQTLKAKLERSELSVAERTREMSEWELRAKGAEEQKAELERRAEHLARTGAANEAQMKLFQEDLEETKNQQLETRERERKRLETELEMSRTEVRDQQHRAQDSERRGAQLTHQIDKLERELRERDLQLERLRKRMQEPEAARAEAELHQRLDNALEDRKKLEQLVDQLRAQNDVEQHQQFEQFRIDCEQLEMSIHCLKKELADRHVLISSQNEKIAQLDNAIAKQQLLEENGGDTKTEAQKQTAARECSNGGGGEGDGDQQQIELDRTRRDMDRLLERVRELEREKRQRQHQTAADGMEEMNGNGKMPAGSSTMSGVSGSTEERTTDALKHRIHELEEALQESVGITSEREKALAEQKKLCQKLSDQVTELFEAGGGAAVSQHQRQLRDALNALAEARSRLEEERLRSQQTVGTVRKELGMALVAEKEAAIALVHSCYEHDGIAPQAVQERLEQMHRQKERLRHALLTSTTGCGGGEKQQEELTRALGTAPPTAAVAAAAPVGHAGRQQQFSQPISIQTSSNICGFPHAQLQHPPPLGMSAPASLTYYGGGVNNAPHQQLEDFGGGAIASLVDEEGIWA